MYLILYSKLFHFYNYTVVVLWIYLTKQILFISRRTPAGTQTKDKAHSFRFHCEVTFMKGLETDCALRNLRLATKAERACKKVCRQELIRCFAQCSRLPSPVVLTCFEHCIDRGTRQILFCAQWAASNRSFTALIYSCAYLNWQIKYFNLVALRIPYSILWFSPIYFCNIVA